MSLGNVPLALKVGNRYVTSEISSLSFREDAVGGITDISFNLSRPLDVFDTDLVSLAPVYLYDTRSAETIGEARLSDTGRSVGDAGQMWDCVAFGPAVAASDRRFPYVIVDTRLDTFVRSHHSTKNASTGTNERNDTIPSLLIQAEEGKTITTSWVGDLKCRTLQHCGMKLGRVRASWDAGLTLTTYELGLYTYTGSGVGAYAVSDTASTTGGIFSAQVVTDFPNSDNVVSVRAQRNTGSTTGAETHWFEFYEMAVRALLLNADGTEITTGYTTDTVTSDQVVNDLLGRVLDQFDPVRSKIAAGSYAIDQLAYPDGITAAEVMDDLMALDPGFRWTTGPSDGAGSGYQLVWEAWPTVIRYEATLDDAASFASSTQELYNEVTVRYQDPVGITRSTTVTAANPTLDARGIVRSTIIDASDETGSAAAAAQLGANFLAEHTHPPNAGTITINRPIYDHQENRMVDPHEIRAGHLIRVRGVESYPDALNAVGNDGLTVFRVWSKQYTSENHSATLELDTYPRTTANALGLLMKRRTRKR